MQGLGRTVFQSGNLHEGEYLHDKRHGWGRFIWSDGSWYDGYWLNGMRHGQGKYVNAAGEAEEGMWKDGELQTAEALAAAAQLAAHGPGEANPLQHQPLRNIQFDPNNIAGQFDAINPLDFASYPVNTSARGGSGRRGSRRRSSRSPRVNQYNKKRWAGYSMDFGDPGNRGLNQG